MMDHSKTTLLGIQFYGPNGEPTFFAENKINDMNTNTPVTDEMVKKFISDTNPEPFRKAWLAEWENFKSQHSSSGREWEITCMKHENKFSDVYFRLRPNNKFVSEDFPSEEFDLNEDLLNNKLGKKYSIHSVRRLSDGEIFTVGDTLHSLGFFSNEVHKISSIQIINGTIGLNYGNGGSVIIQAANKDPIPPPKPVSLFTTEDGVDLFDRKDEVWGVDKKKLVRVTGNGNWLGTWLNGWYCVHYIPNPKENDPEVLKFIKDNFAIFSSEQAATEYILMNKPCLSAQEVIELWKGEDYLPAQIKILAQSKITP